MASPLKILLCLTGITGIWGVLTVSKVSLKTGDSLTIPCFYETRYRNNVKYLCEGYSWARCSPVIKTNQPQESGKYCISDSKMENIFTVTIKNLNNGPAYYWCNVEINRGRDDGTFFELSVTTGQPRLHVAQQQFSGFRGESLTINCTSNNKEKISWCKIKDKCEKKPTTETHATFKGSVQTLSVTMKELKLEDSGWYWFRQGDIQFPVYLTVKEKSTPSPTTTEREGITNKHEQTSSDLTNMKPLVIGLSLLVFTIIVVLIIYLILTKKHAKRKSIAEQLKNVAESEGDVTYSSVVAMSNHRVVKSVKQTKLEEENVTYSTLKDCRVHV